MLSNEYSALTEIKALVMPEELTVDQKALLPTVVRQSLVQQRVAIEKDAQLAVQMGRCKGKIGACAVCLNGTTCEVVSEILANNGIPPIEIG